MDVPERSEAWVIDVDHMPALFGHILSHLPHRRHIMSSCRFMPDKTGCIENTK